MKTEFLALREANNFSPIFFDYLDQKEKVREFYNKTISLENLSRQSDENSFSAEKREVLHSALVDQYQQVHKSDKLAENLALLRLDNTFTVTTGHQLNIFTGPLYFVYKIVSTINLCKELSLAYPEKNFVPIYWAATEDHDFAEINHFHLFNKTYEWKTEQSGAVGRFSTEGLVELIMNELPEKSETFLNAYKQGVLSDAVREYINDLFGSEGLLMLDADTKLLKAQFSDIIKDELVNNSSEREVNLTNEKFKNLNYKPQVKPREINLFYLKENLRERIVKENNRYKVLNTELEFTESEMLKLVDTNPEFFSPNVILRPLYQETVLPNLAYVGGPSELVYWLQLKSTFDYHNLIFPILIPRNFALVVDESNQKKATKLGFDIKDLFLSEKEIKTSFIDKNEKNEFDLSGEVKDLELIFENIKLKSERIDRSLVARVEAESKKAKQSILNLEKKISKSLEQKNETGINQVLNLKNKLFPENGLQERRDNLLNFYFNYPNLIDALIQHLKPLDFNFNILFLDEKERS